VENSNFQIARLLKGEKTRLINALSQFPVTALWLLNEYEQNCYMAEQDDEAMQESELITTLADIKKSLIRYPQSFDGCFYAVPSKIWYSITTVSLFFS